MKKLGKIIGVPFLLAALLVVSALFLAWLYLVVVPTLVICIITSLRSRRNHAYA